MTDKPEDRKPDFSNFPRGAIGIGGLPVSRNARLTSIRTPRDLMLGAQPKRTFVPNIPVRREKRTTESNTDSSQPSSSSAAMKESKPAAIKTERGRGRGRGKEIIQTEGSIFGEGTAFTPKERSREPSYSRSGFSSKKVSVKKEKDVTMFDMSCEMNKLLRDNFIDDGIDDDDVKETGPIVYPIQEINKKETEKSVKKENIDQDFNNEDFAKELGFDVQKISKFIKKEKTEDEVIVKQPIETASDVPKNGVADLLMSENTQLMLLKFPQCFVPEIQDQPRNQPVVENTPSNEKDTASALSTLPEGKLGKIQILKSGVVRLVVGSLHFKLDYLTSLTSKHEVVSINTDTESGDIAVLANVKNSINIAPDVVGVLT